MHDKNFEEIKVQIYELLKLRSKIISGTLPVDELKQVTRQVTSEIDKGNKLLGLDLVVRDKEGNLINPDKTSTIQLYSLHKNATERMTNHKVISLRCDILNRSMYYNIAHAIIKCYRLKIKRTL